jgi:iron complex transport system ATP-binding protein
MIRAHKVGYSRGPNRLLSDVSLDVLPGEVLAIVGPNGAGKSTLMRILAGEWAPSTGEVTLDGESLSRMPPRDLALRRAVLPQRQPWVEGLSGAETAALGRAPYAESEAESLRAAHRALGAAGADLWAGRRMETLSGGEAQRVHFARALAQLGGAQSRYCFLDEPTSALDLAGQLDLMERLRSLADQGVGVVAVVHDLNLAVRFADQMAVLAGGRLHAWGPPETVVTEGLINRAFGVRATVIPHPLFGCPVILPLESKNPL